MKDKSLKDNKSIRNITLVSLTTNVILSVFKVIIGAIGFSSAMVADGIHSLSDALTDIVVLIGVKLSGRPADADHNYGHEKYEAIAIAIISICLFFVAFVIIRNGIVKIIALSDGLPIPPPRKIALYTAIVSIIVKEILYRYTIKYSKKFNSNLLRANAWHHRSDALSSIGSFIGIAGAIFLGNNWIVLDPLTSIIIAIFIFKVAYDIMKPAFNELTDKSISSELRDKITSIIESHDGVLGYHHLHARAMGNKLIIEIHIFVDKDLSVEKSHRIASLLEDRISESLKSKVLFTIHIEPYDEERANKFKVWR